MNDLIRKLLFPVKVYGSNALLVFIISGVTFATFDNPCIPVGGEIVSFRTLGYSVFSTFMPDSQSASFALAFTFVCLLYPPLWYSYSKRWIFKI